MGVSFNIMCPNSSIYSDEKSRVLVDKTKSGKVRPWREKKIANVDYFELLHILEFKKAERVKDCAEILEYKQNRETGERKLYRVWFCKSRLCPMCNWRRAINVNMVRYIFAHLSMYNHDHNGYHYSNYCIITT